MNEKAAKLFADFGVDIDPSAPVRDLTPGHMQIVEIAKAVSKNARILILDEPTAPLSVAEVDILMSIVRKLKADGVAIIYISHRLDVTYELMNGLVEQGKAIVMVTSDMEELLGMSDRIMVFGERCLAGELEKAEFSQERILDMASSAVNM